VVEIHESKENAEASRDEHAKNHPSYQFWVEEDLLFLATPKVTHRVSTGDDAADGAMKGIKAKERLNYIDNIVFTYEGKDLDWYKKIFFKNPLFKDKKLTPYELEVLQRAMKLDCYS